MNTQDGAGRDLIWAAVVVLFAAGVLFGAGLARLGAGEPSATAFYWLLGGALAWASSVSGRASGS